MTQLLAAILTGIVVDQTGAVIPNVTVQYLPERTVKTDTNGRYTTPNLPAGIYGLRLSAPGFFIGHISPMPLAADDVKELPAITLRVAYKHSAFYCGMKFANPRYTHKPAPASTLRGKISAPGTYTLRATSPDYPTFEIQNQRHLFVTPSPSCASTKRVNWKESPHANFWCSPHCCVPAPQRVLRTA